MSIGATREKPPPLFRLTVKQYHGMIRSSILTENDPVELLEGVLVEKMPHDPLHDSTVSRLNRLFTRLLGEEWAIRVQCAVTLANSEPEPDLVIAIGPEGRYDDRHPGPKDIELIVEVANTTLEFDRIRKGRVYARAGVAVYWVVNVKDCTVEVYTDPRGGKNPCYSTRTDFSQKDHLSIMFLGESVGRVSVKSIMPK